VLNIPLSEGFGQLGNLRELNMAACPSLLSLPDSFCDLSNLTKLSFCDEYGNGCSELESLPERFGQLKSLTSLNLSGDYRIPMKLEYLPEGISSSLSTPALLFLQVCLN
jgi:hypothetical protein